LINVLRPLSFVLIAVFLYSGKTQAQIQDSKVSVPSASTVQIGKFSQGYTTQHSLQLAGQTLKFTATAENYVFNEPEGGPRVEIASITYTKDNADPATRPVAFIVNGGPGASSAYLNLLAIGPWRTPLGGSRYSASLSTLQPNTETWLDFTDLVFIDPPGTGYSRVTGGEWMRQYFRSVDGDIDALADFIRRWLRDRNRLLAPIYFVGASYGGFRGPLLARKLQLETLKNLNGLILVSPVLDFNLFPLSRAIQPPWVSASILPSLAAIWAERNSSLTPELLQEAEAYASGEYISDLVQGIEDTEAIDRIARRIEKLTGIQRNLTRISKGRIDVKAFVRSLERKPAPNLGSYNVHEARSTVEYSEDHDLEYVTGILTSEMDGYFKNMLKFQTSETYKVIDYELTGTWRWNNGRYGVEALSTLQQAMNADRGMRVLIAHGTNDLTTPYYATKILSAQIDVGQPRRLDFKLYSGNHMFYTREASRKAFRADAKAFIDSE
jgi:carboxypeptidase C (cathepsin A)